MRIEYINGLAGSGKTYQAIIIDAVKRVQTGDRVMVAMPTLKLIEQTMADLPPLSVPVSKIVSDDRDSQSVASKIRAKLKSSDVPELVFITHAGLKIIPYVGKTNWQLIVDEIPPVQELIKIPVDEPELAVLLASCTTHSLNDGFKNISMKAHPNKVLKFPTNPADQTPVHKLAWRLFGDNSAVFTTDAVDEQEIDDDDDVQETKTSRKIPFFCLTLDKLFEPFQSVLIMAANFKSSLLYKMWKGKVKFVNNTMISKKLKFQEHNGSNVKINYLFNTWSRTFYEKEYEDGRPLMYSVLDRINETHCENYLWVANAVNKQAKVNVYDTDLSGVRLPNISHGMNCYQDYDSVIFLSALNPSNMEVSFFKNLCGLSRADITEARYHEGIYQAVMRSRLRKNEGKPVSILVMDKKAAEFLQSLLIGSTVEKLDWFELKNKISNAMTATERQRKCRAKKKAAKAASLELASLDVTKTSKDLLDKNVTHLDSTNRSNLSSNWPETVITMQDQWKAEAIRKYQSVKASGPTPIVRNHLARLARELKNAKLDNAEIKTILNEQVIGSYKENDRKRQIPNLMKIIQKNANSI